MDKRILEQQIADFRNAFVASPYLKKIMHALDECRMLSKLGGAPECLLVTGDTGAGKTTLIDKYLELNTRTETLSRTIIPVLFTSLPGDATPTLLFQQILSDLKHPFPFETSNEVELRAKIKTLLTECGVELIIIDEFQHLIERKSLQILGKTANSLKSLIVDTKVPVALFGMPYSSVILDANSQLGDRFRKRRAINPFRISTESECQYFRAFLNKLDENLPFDEPQKLTGKEFTFRLYAYCQGNLRKLKDLLNDAVLTCIMSGKNSLDIQTLAKSAMSIDEKLTDKTNPFLVEIDNLVATEPSDDFGWGDYQKGMNARPKPKQIKQLRISDVLL